MAVDTGGLEATSSTGATVRVDCTPPSLTLTPAAGEVVEGDVVDPPVVEAFDAASGVAATAIELSVDGGAWSAASAPVVAEAGRTYAFRARARDVAGNWSGWLTADAVVGAPPPPPQEEEDEAPQEEGGEDEAPQVLEAPVVELGAAVELGEVALAAAVAEPSAPAPVHDVGERGADTVAPVIDPRLRITHVLTRRRLVEIRGTAAPALVTTGRVTLRTAHGVQRRRRVKVANGKWRARFRVPARTHRPRTVVAATRATATHAAGTARWRAP